MDNWDKWDRDFALVEYARVTGLIEKGAVQGMDHDWYHTEAARLRNEWPQIAAAFDAGYDAGWADYRETLPDDRLNDDY